MLNINLKKRKPVECAFFSGSEPDQNTIIKLLINFSFVHFLGKI